MGGSETEGGPDIGMEDEHLGDCEPSAMWKLLEDKNEARGRMRGCLTGFLMSVGRMCQKITLDSNAGPAAGRTEEMEDSRSTHAQEAVTTSDREAQRPDGTEARKEGG